MQAEALAVAESALREAANQGSAGAGAVATPALEQDEQHTIDPLQLQQHLHGLTGGDAAAQQNLLQNLMGVNATQEQKVALLELLSRQQQEHGQLPPEPAVEIRPEKHYLSISQNGDILEATNTVTGFPPDALLMTSAYEDVYDEDLPGLLCIKSHCWDKGDPDVEVFLRRRTVDGEWVWLQSKAVAYIDQPYSGITGITLEETLVKNESWAQYLNRIIRITAILVQAVEAAWLTEQRNDNKCNHEAVAVATDSAGDSVSQEVTTSTDCAPSPDLESLRRSAAQQDAPALKSMIETIEALSAAGVEIPGGQETVSDWMRFAESISSSASNGKNLSSPGTNGQGQQQNDKSPASNQKKPSSMMDAVRKGVRLDLGLTRLVPEEVKLMTLVLTGKLPVNDVVPVVRNALSTGVGLKGALLPFKLDSEKLSPRVLRAANGFNHHLGNHFNRKCPLPPISVLNLSYTYIGNSGVEMMAEILSADGSPLKTLDISFCGIEERGLLALARSIGRRKRKRIAPLLGLILSGNYFSSRAAAEMGSALSPAAKDDRRNRKRVKIGYTRRTGYDSDSNESSDDDSDGDDGFAPSRRRKSRTQRGEKSTATAGVTGPTKEERGLRLLHVAHASLTAEATARLLEGLGAQSGISELNLASNYFGTAGATALVRFFEDSRVRPAMPCLDRIDMSNNNLGDDGTTQLTRAIVKRSGIHIVELKLSSNSICSGGIETIMNKLLQHNLLSLSLDKNAIGDQGCQLVAASLQSMKSLSRLNLGFNQIGSRGINSLMRSLVACESITYLGLSGNMLRISGAFALAFMLAQHPRLEELDLDNCCLSQAAQCHIVAGIISNRWVPMKRLKGCAVGPPMAAIGALEPYASTMSNEECFRFRKDEQMKTIFQWMESNLSKKLAGEADQNNPPPPPAALDPQSSRFLSPDFIASVNDVGGAPSQNAYYRLLGWLSRIPFDDDELTALQKYFYDADGGEGDRGSDGYINLKLRGDLLAALDSGMADEIRDEFPSLASELVGSVGIDLDKLFGVTEEYCDGYEETTTIHTTTHAGIEKTPENPIDATEAKQTLISKQSSEQKGSGQLGGKEKRGSRVKPRITMFPRFEQQLDELKATATDMIEQEEDPMQHDVILTQYAEASLTILRQLRYYCMNSGLDGWRNGGLKRKVLIVDDSAVTRKLVSRAFETANFIADTAANGAEGVEKLKASIYDIAFMDIDMPVMNGFEATKKLREWENTMRPGARQPICALTATYVDDFQRSELMKFKEAGLDVMESKPCNIPRLLKVVDDVSPMFSDLSISVTQRERLG